MKKDTIFRKDPQIENGIQEDKPEKIPDELLVKYLQIELGKKEAYIQELEFKLSLQGSEQAKEIRKEVRASEMYQNLKKQLDKANKELARLRKSLSELASRATVPK